MTTAPDAGKHYVMGTLIADILPCAHYASQSSQETVSAKR
jgi:hypothetical protein